MRITTLAMVALLLAVTAARAQPPQNHRSAQAQAAPPTGGVEYASPPPPTVEKLAAPPGVPEGIWLLPEKAAVQIYGCGELLCGRIVWLERPRNPEGHLVIDKKNPDPTLRDRPICDLTVLTGLQPAGPDHWKDGRLYNPDDGTTYRIRGEFRDADTLVVRIYLGIPLFGQTSIWRRVPRLKSEGWC